MAIYRFNVTVISRSQGKSAVACAAYRAGEKLYDQRLDKTYDFTNKPGIIYKEILLPKDAPTWMADREKLWNTVEVGERRKDAQLAREATITLPRELSDEQNIALAKEFVQKQFVDRGMVADLCFHNHRTEDGENQPHAHVMLSMREVTKDGFGLKVTAWNKKPLLELLREEWANVANKHLALAGIDQRIDHRSNEERGIPLEPQYKIGPVIAQDRMARMEDHQRIARENGNAIFLDPKIAINAITMQQATFTERDLAKFINRHTENAEQFQRVYDKVKASDLIISLGKDDKDRERFTSKEMLEIESTMMQTAKVVQEQNNHAVNQDNLAKIADSFQLSGEQTRAFEYLVADGDLKNVVGYAGTGKSRLLGAARAAWEENGYRVLGAALSGIAAENLEASSGIESRTLASLTCAWRQDRELLTAKDILVIDEAGMFGTRQLAEVIKESQLRGAKLAFTGDPQEQLQAIEAGAAFRGIIDATSSKIELKEIWRQQVEWQKEASALLSTRQTGKALAMYEAHDCVHEFSTKAEAKQALIEAWDDIRMVSPEKTLIMMTYKRDDVFELNAIARELRKSLGELGPDQLLHTARGERQFATGEIVYFLKNDRELGVKNGTLGTILTINNEELIIKLNKGDTEKSKIISFSTERYQDLDYGYASTVHKGQGGTFDRTLVLASRYLDRHSTNVAFTRHRDGVELYWSKDEFPRHDILIRCLSRDASKDLASDYIQLEAEKATFASSRGLYGVWEKFWENNGARWVEKIQYLFDKASNSRDNIDAAARIKKIEDFTRAALADPEFKSLEKKLQRLDFDNLKSFNNTVKSEFSALKESELNKLKEFTLAAQKDPNFNSAALHEKLQRSDFSDFTQQFEAKNPELAKSLLKELNQSLEKNERTAKQIANEQIKEKAREHEPELELER